MKYLPLFLFFYLSIFDARASFYNNWSEPVNISELNSEEDDFAPAYNKFQKLLYFNSTRTKYSMFYSSEVKENNSFSSPVLRSDELNKEYNHQSYITFLNQDNCIFSTYHQKLGRAYINLYNAYFKKNKWTSVSLIDSLSGSFFASHPTVSSSGGFLIFSSDRSVKDTDTDLYISYQLDDGSWGEAVPMQLLNSPGNEITPFLANDTTLYFASNGLGGPGGYDIFVSYKKDDIWSRPYPLSSINTQFDESDPCLMPDNTMIFASDRPGGKGKLDLYSAKYIEPMEEVIINEEFEISAASPVYSIKIEQMNLYDLSLTPNLLFVNNSIEQKVLNEIINSDLNFSIEYNFNNKKLNDTLDFIINANAINNKIKKFNNINLNDEVFASADSHKFSLEETYFPTTSISPNKIEISYNSRPFKLFKSGECFFISNNISFKIADLETPSNVIDLALSDSLVRGINNFTVRLKAIDLNKKAYFKDLDFLISSKESKEIKIHLFNDIPYRKISFAIPENTYLKDELIKYLGGEVIKNTDEIIIEASNILYLDFLKSNIKAQKSELKQNNKLSENVINLYIRNY